MDYGKLAYLKAVNLEQAYTKLLKEFNDKSKKLNDITQDEKGCEYCRCIDEKLIDCLWFDLPYINHYPQEKRKATYCPECGRKLQDNRTELL